MKHTNQYSNIPPSKKYSAIHKWIKKNFGNPPLCEKCGKIGKKVGRNWNIHWANISGLYIRKRDDFMGLCVSCHHTKDGNVLNFKKMRKVIDRETQQKYTRQLNKN